MARPVSRKQINCTLSKVARNYLNASNANGISEGTRKHLTEKWACFSEIAYLLATGDRKTLESIEFDSQSWLVSCEQVAAEAAS